MKVSRAVTAGLIGGFTVDLFLLIIRAIPFPGVYQFIASVLVGPVAFSSSAYIALGLLLHFTIAIAFAVSYAFVAGRFPALIEQPILWGSAFGIAVMIVMQVVLAVGHAGRPPSLMGIVIGLIAHIVFFGLPVALFIARGRSARPLAA